MGDERQMRQRELELLITRIHKQMNAAAELLHAAQDTADDVGTSTVEAVAFQVLDGLTRSEQNLTEARKVLSVAMVDRGSPIARVARNAGVSRAAVHHWVKARDERELDPS